MAGVFAAANAGQRTWTEYAAGIAVGVVLGAAFALTTYAAGRRVVTRLGGQPDAASRWPFRLLYLCAVIWVIAGFMSGMSLAQMLSS